MSENKAAPNYSVPALEKGLAVLELLAQASEPLSLSQISDQTDNSTSQLFRTMNCLAESGYVIKDDVSGKYTLTLKLFELANRHSPLEHLLQMAALPMQELAWTIRESCHISIIQQRQLLGCRPGGKPGSGADHNICWRDLSIDANGIGPFVAGGNVR